MILRVEENCKCGGRMVVEIEGSNPWPQANEMVGVFQAEHKGDGHGSCSRKASAQMRRMKNRRKRRADAG